MSDVGSCEDLSDELIEDLKAKGLLSFVLFEQSTNHAITLLIYDNEKYRPIVREWGSAVGIHIFPPIDRRPFTDDMGKHSISGPLSEIQPIKGFKWLGNWAVTIEKGLTDDEGYQYARGWGILNSKHTLADTAGRLRFVRRRQWTRVMVVDPDPPAKRLPFELEIRILGTTVQNMTSVSQMESYVDTYFNDVLHSTTFVSQKQGSSAIGSPSGSTSSVSASGKSANTTCTTTVVRPLHALDPNLKVSFVVHRNRLSSANLSSAGRVDMLLGQIIEDKDKGFIDHEYPLKNTTNRFLQLSIELKEQKLFSILKVNPKQVKANGGEIVEVVLSPRLQNKIIILSLAIESNCNGLLDEIVGFLTEAVNYVTELDLFDIIDDINQMYKKSEFSKLITLLQDSDHPLKSVTPYPVIHSEWCVYTKVVALPPPEGDSSSGNANAGPAALASRRGSVRNPAAPSRAFQQRYEEVTRSNEKFLKYQPFLSRDHMPGFMKHAADTPEVANITPGLRGYRLTICCSDNAYYELVWGNFYEYIQMQKIFSMLKYQPEEVESGRLDDSWQVLYYPPVHHDAEASESIKVALSLSAENMCFQIAAMRAETTSSQPFAGGNPAGAFEPITIGFDEIEYVEVGCSHHISAGYLLEVKLLSLQAQLLRYMMQNKTYVELDTADGQHFRVDLNGNKTESHRLSSSSSFPINETLRVLIPAALMTGPGLDEFLYMTIQTDGTWDECNATDITQRSAAMVSDPDTYYPATGMTVGSFKAESRSKSMFSSRKNSLFAPGKEGFEEPRQQVNKTVIKLCNRVAVPLSGLVNKITTEQESQVTLYKLNCVWKLRVYRIEGQRRSTDPTYTYFVVYFADANGDPISYYNERDSGSMSSPTRPSKSSKSSSGSSSSSSSSSTGATMKPGYVFKSSATPNSGSATWGEGDVVDISTERHGDVMNNVKYVLIQFWTKNTTTATESPLGETLIPMLSANKVPLDDIGVGTIETAAKHRVLLPSMLNTRKTSQTVNTGLIASMQLNMCAVTDADYDASDRSSVKLVTCLKPVQSADCSWPCRFLTKQLGGVEAEVFYFFPAHDGLYIFGQPNTSAGDRKRHQNSVGTVLSECLERKTSSSMDNRLQLVIPYSQVATHDMHIITDNMLVLSVLVKRSIKVAGSNLNSIVRDIKLEMLVGPCLAKDLYTIMHNRISLFFIRSTLTSYATDKRKEEPEVFENVAKMLQDEMLSTIMSIDQFQAIKPHVSNGHSHNDHSHLFPLKLLYLKKAALKIYLWFLIEQTKLQFGGKQTYLDSPWMLFDENNPESEDAQAIYEDTEALMQRISQIMEHLDKDVRSMVFQAHKLQRPDISDRLSGLIYDKFLAVINYLMRSINLERTTDGSTAANNEKIYRTADPQKKRDLIKYIITHDNMFEVCLNSSLRPHDYQFSLSPLLSICIDFEQLIDKFASLVNENILLWNARTFEHFRTHKDASSVLSNQDFAPWAVTSMIEGNTNHELYISNIPETIQTQLNVEIGLKKVPIVGTNMGAASLARVFLLNQKISAAIAKVYLALASEYEKVLISGVQNLILRDTNAKGKSAVTVQDKDDLICFLISIVNDCHRMYTKHIPDSMSNFLEEDEDGNPTEASRGSMMSIMESVQREGGAASIMDQSCMLFLVSSRAMEAVSQNAINQLSNQIFFLSDLRVYFLLAFDAHVVAAQPSRWKNKRGSTTEGNQAESHSPIEVICATLSDFFQFTSQHLNDDDIEKLLYVCIKKVVIRYLVFLRDLLVMLPAANANMKSPKKSKRRGSRASELRKSFGERDSSDEPLDNDEEEVRPDRFPEHEEDSTTKVTTAGFVVGNTDSPLQPEQIQKIKADVKSIIRLHSILKLKIQQAGAAGERSAEACAETEKEDTEYHTFFNNSAANLFGIVSDVANRLMMGEITETAMVDDIVYNFFSITPPVWTADRNVYERALASFLELNSNFIQQNENGDAAQQSAQNYTIQISNLSCVKQHKYKNCFIRVLFDNQVRETAVRSSSMIQHATSWDGVITFNNIQNYENKCVEFQVMGYRLRALQHYRERLIGSVKVNLSVLAQSSPYIADVAPAPSVSRKSFAARMSMSEALNRDSLQDSHGGGGNGQGGPGNSIILANHCAWFVVDKKPRKSDNPSSASVLKADGNKDNSVVRLLSSENVRMDIEDTQLRVGIKMMKNGV